MTQQPVSIAIRLTAAELGRVLQGETVAFNAGLEFSVVLRGDAPPPPAEPRYAVPPPPPRDPLVDAERLRRMDENMRAQRELDALAPSGVGGRIATNGD